jgi:hypothetical protein
MTQMADSGWHSSYKPILSLMSGPSLNCVTLIQYINLFCSCLCILKISIIIPGTLWCVMEFRWVTMFKALGKVLGLNSAQNILIILNLFYIKKSFILRNLIVSNIWIRRLNWMWNKNVCQPLSLFFESKFLYSYCAQ